MKKTVKLFSKGTAASLVLLSLSAVAQANDVAVKQVHIEGNSSVEVIQIDGKAYATYIASAEGFSEILPVIFSPCKDAVRVARKSAFELCHEKLGKDCRAVFLTKDKSTENYAPGQSGTLCTAVMYVVDKTHPVDLSAPVSFSVANHIQL